MCFNNSEEVNSHKPKFVILSLHKATEKGKSKMAMFFWNFTM